MVMVTVRDKESGMEIPTNYNVESWEKFNLSDNYTKKNTQCQSDGRMRRND